MIQIREIALCLGLTLLQSAHAQNMPEPVKPPSQAPAKSDVPKTVRYSGRFATGTRDVTIQERGNTREVVLRTFDSAGKELLREECVYEWSAFPPRAILKSYAMEQRQSGESYLISPQVDKSGKSKLLFKKTHQGRTDDDSEDLKPVEEIPTLAAPTLVPWMQLNWARLAEGATLELRLVVADRMETVGFKIFKVESTRPGTVRIRMKPTSVFIQAARAPLHFDFAPDGSRLLIYEGPVPLKPEIEVRMEFNHS